MSIESSPVPVPAAAAMIADKRDILVSDAKKLIEVKYPKLHGRFNFAFNGLPDDMTLREAVDAISGDVEGWLAAMPDNFKTSSHAISRPKFGLSFILQQEEVRAALGGDYCDIKNTGIEREFEALKKDFVVPAEKKDVAPAVVAGAPVGEAQEEEEEEDDEATDVGTRSLVTRLEEENAFLKASLIRLVHEQHGSTMSTIIGTLLNV